MNINHFFILKIAAVLVFTGSAVFAAKATTETTKAAAPVATVAKTTKDAPLSDAQKFYGTELKSSKKVVHPPYAWGDCTLS